MEHRLLLPGPLKFWLPPLVGAASGCKEYLTLLGSGEGTRAGAPLLLSVMEAVPRLAHQGMLGEEQG